MAYECFCIWSNFRVGTRRHTGISCQRMYGLIQGLIVCRVSNRYCVAWYDVEYTRHPIIPKTMNTIHSPQRFTRDRTCFFKYYMFFQIGGHVKRRLIWSTPSSKVKCILGVKQLVYTYVSAAVGFPIIKQFKQCRSIPVAMLKIMHLATVQTCPNGVEQRQIDFG
jgi:hypothetical protein